MGLSNHGCPTLVVFERGARTRSITPVFDVFSVFGTGVPIPNSNIKIKKNTSKSQ